MRKPIIVLGIMLYLTSPANQSELIPVDKSFSAIVTAYTCNYESTGKSPSHPDYCRTASGHILKSHDAYTKVAADNNFYKFGTILLLEGIGEVIVVDTGGDIEGEDRFDLYIGENLQIALDFGKQNIKVIRKEEVN